MCFLLMTLVPVQKLCVNIYVYIYIYMYVHSLYEFCYRSYIQRECHSVLAKLHPITFYRIISGECAVPGLNATFCFLWFTNCVLLFDKNLNTRMLVTFGICFKQHFDTRYLVFYNTSPPRMFLSLDLLWEYRIQHGANGHLCLVHPGVRDERRVSEINLSQPRHETGFWWRHNGLVTSQSTDPIKWRNYPLELIGIYVHINTHNKESLTQRCRRSTNVQLCLIFLYISI